MESYLTILLGILSGVIFALAGYFKSMKHEEFDIEKFIQTVAVGAIVGFICGVTGWSYEVALEWLKQTGLISLIEMVKKGLIRLFKK